MNIEQDLKEVNELIEENKRLQEKYPEKKFELEVGLMSLMELRKEMEQALENQKKAQKKDRGTFKI